MPLHTHVFSFTHNAVVLSGFRCVHPENQTKIFRFYILWIKTNVAYTRLQMIARTKYCTTTTASNWFVTLYCKLLPAVRSPSKHGRWWSSLLLYSISMGLVDRCGKNRQNGKLLAGKFCNLEGKNKEINKGNHPTLEGNLPCWREIFPSLQGNKHFFQAC